MTDPHDMVGIGCPQAQCTSPSPQGAPKRMTVRSMDVSAKMDAPYVPTDDYTKPAPTDRTWFVLWLVGGAILWFSPDPDPGPVMRSTR
jgi:hypothetical protein